MAITKKSIYNAALIEVGAAILATDTDDRDERYDLDLYYTDHNYPLGALEAVKPRFACKTAANTGAATAGGVTLAYTHTLPADFLSLVGLYSDAELDQPVTRFIQDGSTILTDYETVYIRYVRNDVAIAAYSALFVDYLGKYLAHAIAPKYSPDRVDAVEARMAAAFELVVETEGEKEPTARAATPGTNLSTTWLYIYNGALQILGKPKLPANNADHPFRVALDTTLESKAVESVLIDTNWRFGNDTVKLTYDPDNSPTAFGYRYAFDLPTDILRRTGVYQDEYTRVPLNDYTEDALTGFLYCEREEIYIRYVDRDWVTQPASWPEDFQRLVMARMARDAAKEIAPDEYDDAVVNYKTAKTTAIGNDMVQNPSEPLAGGSWVSSRFRYDHWADRRGRSGS